MPPLVFALFDDIMIMIFSHSTSKLHYAVHELRSFKSIFTKNCRSPMPSGRSVCRKNTLSQEAEMLQYIRRNAQQGDSWEQCLERWLEIGLQGRRLLIVPPDHTRGYSCAGQITAWLYRRLCSTHEIRVLPAVGTHQQMTAAQCSAFFPGVPPEAFLTHDWRTGTETVGIIARQTVERISGGLYSAEIPVQVNRLLLTGGFTDILSVGQVVPHEVAGFANYSKNILVGLGGREMINHSHMIGAVCGLEGCMGNADTPVRTLFDEAQRLYLDPLGITFMLTVTTVQNEQPTLEGLWISKERDGFVQAAALSGELNVTRLPKRVHQVVAWLDPEEFQSTWVGNKAIYRTRMAIADGGELLVIAPGVKRFGESDTVDGCIRRYGYCGTKQVMEHMRSGAFANLEMAAAHLIHGSSEGRFRVTYATDPTQLPPQEVAAVGFAWMDVDHAIDKYTPTHRETGAATVGSEEFYFVRSPSTGLWRT
jgi:nickel-dependent lactate racemase